MRIPQVLSPCDLPEPELIAAMLDGELHRLGGAFCPVDAIAIASDRAASIAAEAPEWAIAEQRTAAWVYGAAPGLPRPLQLCVDSRSRVHPVSTRLHAFREVVMTDHDARMLGGMAVTTPLRTALDLTRFSPEFSVPEYEIIRELAVIGGFDLSECVRAIAQRRNLPNKHLALRRLDRASDYNRAASTQPALTRYTS